MSTDASNAVPGMPAPIPPEEAMESAGVSLPSVEEARAQAAGKMLNEDSVMSADDKDLEDVPTHSLPTPEEARLDANVAMTAQDDIRRSKHILYLSIASLVFAIVIIVGLSVGLTTKNKTKSPDPRMDEVVNFLNKVSLESDLARDGSPQRDAAYWIADSDANRLPIPTSPTAPDAFVFLQRYALAVLYFATGGENWSAQLGFLENKDTCDWRQQFILPGGTYIVGVFCDDDKVSKISIPGNRMKGQLPPEIGLLSNLNHLSFFSNEISGELPSEVQKLSSLTFLAMNNNDLSGSIPSWLDKLPVLKVLGFGNNNLNGEIPASIGKMSQLIEISLDDNNLSGGVDVLNSLVGVENLYLEDNNFEGELGETFLADLQSLQVLDISNNQFEGQLPAHLLTHPTLVVFDAHQNLIGGPFPDDLVENQVLEFLALYSNLLVSAIPSEISYLSALRHLDMADNGFDGEIPASIGQMTNLQYLFLGGEAFQAAPIPDFVRSLTKLQELSLKQTARTGIIPDWIGEMSNLLLLDLGSNSLEGKIPDSMGDLSELGFLLLHHNQLTGVVPDLSGLSNIAMILIDSNKITGSAEDAGICSGAKLDVGQLQVFTSDCTEDNKEFDCPCCTECCTSQSCKREDMLVPHLDPYFENGYTRQSFFFSDDLIFVINDN